MQTTDLIYQNQKVLNALQEMLLHTKKHVEFLAAGSPEMRTNLESIAESLQTGVDILENQIVFNRDTRNKFAKEVACKNQAYDFIAAEKFFQGSAFDVFLRFTFGFALGNHRPAFSFVRHDLEQITSFRDGIQAHNLNGG